MSAQSEVERIAELWDKKEPLCKELRQHLNKTSYGKAIQHPLLYDVLYHPQRNAELNYRLKIKKKELKRAIRQKNWWQVVLWYERPYRLEAFLEHVLNQTDDKEAAEVLLWVWTDSENIWQNFKLWQFLLERLGEHMRAGMEPEEREALDKLPDVVEVYRGCKDQNKSGLSWTLDKERAEFFAKRYTLPGESRIVLTGKLRKSDILFLCEGRGEKEVVIASADLVQDIHEEVISV